MAILFTITLGLSISVGADRRISDVLWLRVGIVVTFFALGLGVTWARDKV